MSSLHDALRELAEEVDGAPEGLAERTWAAGRADVTRQRRARLLASLTAVAAAAALLWISVVSGLGRSDSAPAEPAPDEAPAAVTGYPQRVVDPGDVDPLPAKGVPLAAVMHSRSQGEGGGWLALRPDGSLWSLPGLMPQQIVAGEGARAEDLVPQPALDPSGRWLAAFEQPADGTRPRLVIIDVTTGARTHHRNVLGGAQPHTRDLVGGTCFAEPGAQLHWRPGGGSPRVALACEGDTGRQVVVVDARGRVVGRTVVESTPGSLGRTTCTRGLAGWLDERRLLDVVVCPDRAHPGTERTILVEVDTDPAGAAPGSPVAGAAQLAVKSHDDRIGPLQGVVPDERLLLLGSTRDGHSLSVARASGSDQQSWAIAPDVTTSAPFVQDRTHKAPQTLANEGSGVPRRLGSTPDVTVWADGGLGIMSLDTRNEPPVALMVIDPGLQVDAVSVAQTALHGEVTRHHLGVRTSWWSWHPLATAALGAGALTCVVGAWVLARRRGWSGPGRATTAVLAVALGIVLAVAVVMIVVRTTQEPAPLPSPGVTVQ